MKNAKIKKVAIGILILLMSAMAVSVAGCGSKESLLIGQWELVESNGGRYDVSLIQDKIEFLDDGMGVMGGNVLNLNLTWSFTWRIDNDRLTLIMPEGLAQIYSIVEISKSTLILEGNIPLSGNVRVKYSKKSASQTTKAKKEEEPSKTSIIPTEPLKDSHNSKKEGGPSKANTIGGMPQNITLKMPTAGAYSTTTSEPTGATAASLTCSVSVVLRKKKRKQRQKLWKN